MTRTTLPAERTAAWTLVLLLLLACRLPSLVEPAGADQSLYSYTAQRVLAGGVPYRDAWDQKPPGIFFVYATMWRAGDGEAVVAAADLVAAGVVAWLLVLLGRRTFGATAGYLSAAVFLLLGDPALERLSGVRIRSQCETFIGLAVTAAILLAILSRSRSKRGGARARGRLARRCLLAEIQRRRVRAAARGGRVVARIRGGPLGPAGNGPAQPRTSRHRRARLDGARVRHRVGDGHRVLRRGARVDGPVARHGHLQPAVLRRDVPGARGRRPLPRHAAVLARARLDSCGSSAAPAACCCSYAAGATGLRGSRSRGLRRHACRLRPTAPGICRSTSCRRSPRWPSPPAPACGRPSGATRPVAARGGHRRRGGGPVARRRRTRAVRRAAARRPAAGRPEHAVRPRRTRAAGSIGRRTSRGSADRRKTRSIGRSPSTTWRAMSWTGRALRTGFWCSGSRLACT